MQCRMFGLRLHVVGVTRLGQPSVGVHAGSGVLGSPRRHILVRYSQRDQRGGGYLVRCAETKRLRGEATGALASSCALPPAPLETWLEHVCASTRRLHPLQHPQGPAVGSRVIQGALGLWVAAIASRITEEPQTEVAPCPGLLWLPRPPLHHPGRPGPFDGSLTRARYIYPAYLPHHRPS